MTHSLLFVLLSGIVAAIYGADIALTVMLALVSHLVLDVTTHGVEWNPRLLFPILNEPAITFGVEWEWFNLSWWYGYLTMILWSITCLVLS